MQQWWTQIGGLEDVREPACLDLLASARPVQLKRDTQVFRQGDTPAYYTIVLQGSVRIHSLSPSGREIVLYRVTPGESCVLTTACLIAGDPFPAQAITEADVSAMSIRGAEFRNGLDSSPAFRSFVFSTLGNRLSTLIYLVQEILGRRIEGRLAQKLVAMGETESLVQATHLELANELGTAREVVSRELKKLERSGCIRLHRGSIEIVDSSTLLDLAKDNNV